MTDRNHLSSENGVRPAAKYRVVGTISRSAGRVWGRVGHWVIYGPYKRLKTAKRKATEMRKDRIRTIVDFEDGWRKDENGEWICEDRGPWFTRVVIEEAADD